MAQSQAWKAHERNTAKYFNTERRKRGADFSQSDVEVLADVDQWLGWEGSRAKLVVECKYRNRHGIVTQFRQVADGLAGEVILRMGDIFLCTLESFEQVFIDWIYQYPSCSTSLDEATEGYSLIQTNAVVPQYLTEYIDQAREYVDTLDRPKGTLCLPLTCIAKEKLHLKLIAFSKYDLGIFQAELEQLEQNPTDEHSSTIHSTDLQEVAS